MTNMKIYTTPNQYQYQYKQNFTSNNNEWNVFGIDEGGQAKRDYIRKWHDEHYIPYQSIYEKEGRMSEFELNQLLSYLVRKPIAVSNSKMNNIGLDNLEQIGEKFYRGAMIFGRDIGKVSKLKDAGIRTIIDLVGDKLLREECVANDVKYFHLNVDGIGDAFHSESYIRETNEKMCREIANYDETETQKLVEATIKLWRRNTRNQIKKYIKFINTMQQDNVYIGCEFGTYRTDTALFFNYMLNPNPHNYSEPVVTRKKLIPAIENFYYNLTDIDKLKMGWTKAFEDEFLQKLNDLKNIYQHRFLFKRL